MSQDDCQEARLYMAMRLAIRAAGGNEEGLSVEALDALRAEVGYYRRRVEFQARQLIDMEGTPFTRAALDAAAVRAGVLKRWWKPKRTDVG